VLITTNTFDNEANLPSDYIPGLKKLPKQLQERFLYGSDADMEGRVWDEFSHDKNVRDPFYIPSGWERIVVLDHGFTNPTAVLWAAIDWDGVIYIFDEHYEAGKPISYHAEQIKKRDNQDVKRWFIDPSCSAKTQQKRYSSGVVDLHSIIDEYHDYGLNFEPADNAVLAGINRVNEAFKNGTLIIFKNCINTIREVENWKWQKIKLGAEENKPEEPVNKDDHTPACLRYLLMSRPHATDLKVERGLSIYSPLYKLNEMKRKREQHVH
jgi:phage terminase large subunit